MNIATSTPGSAERTSSTPESLSFGPVHLDVVDRDRSLVWWRDVAGLHDVTEHADTLELGVGGEPLIVLRPTATRRCAAATAASTTWRSTSPTRPHSHNCSPG